MRWKRLLAFLNLNRLDIRWLYLVAAICAARSFVALAAPEVLRRAISAMETQNAGALPSVLLFAAVSTVLYVGVIFFGAVVMQKTVNLYESLVQKNVLCKLFRLTKPRRSAVGQGGFVSTATQNAEMATSGSVHALRDYAGGALAVAISGVYMIALQPLLAVCTIVFNILFRVATRAFDGKIKAASGANAKQRNRNIAYALELLKNTVAVRTFGKYPFFEERLKANESDEQNSSLKGFVFSNTYSELQWMTKKIVEVALLFGVGGMMVSSGRIAFAEVMALLTVSDIFATGCNTLLYAANGASSTLPRIEMVEEFLRDDGVETGDERLVPETAYGVTFENVSFSYGDNAVLNDVSFHIPPGTRVKIVGPNGQGKSTLLYLIAGMLRPTSGAIRFGGQPTADVAMPEMAKAYAYVPQFPQLIPGGAAENIALRENPDAERTSSLMARMHMSGVAGNAPRSYSQGEKQRLMIGRAFYHMPERGMLLGDEIFSNIDTDNRGAAAELLDECCKGKTVFLVTHDDMGISFNKTLVVSGGNVAVREAGETA